MVVLVNALYAAAMGRHRTQPVSFPLMLLNVQFQEVTLCSIRSKIWQRRRPASKTWTRGHFKISHLVMFNIFVACVVWKRSEGRRPLPGHDINQVFHVRGSLIAHDFVCSDCSARILMPLTSAEHHDFCVGYCSCTLSSMQ
ncbi:hypothetical protein M758_7G019100 [Ceratodon purpureus]|nr:hypothetical protein M758_7G019100 [Ceratodon purpureus]